MAKEFYTSQSAKLFDLFAEELIEWNKRFNLTAIDDLEEIKVRHFEDSLSVLEVIDLKDQSVVDVGAGAGFPGIPLKIVCPGIKLTLIEATRKKVEFLDHIIKVLRLKEIEPVWGRAEVLGRDPEYRGKFDLVVSRAVAKLPELATCCLPFLKPKGIFVALKQDKVEAEANKAQKNIKKAKGELKLIKKVKVGEIDRSLVVIEKIG